MSIKVTGLRPGDVVLYRMNAHSFQHSAIVVGGGHLVHADANGGEGFVRSEPIKDTERYCPSIIDGRDDLRFKAEVYRCRDTLLATDAAEYARRFGRNNAQDAGATKYGTDRGRGVSLQLKGDPNPPFEFDAMYRALKWATGGGKGANQFSVNQGTTCAAFVIACFQAAAIRSVASGDEQKISDALEVFRSWRSDKKPTTKAARWTLKQVPGSGLMRPDAYKREVSNVGPDPKSVADWTRAKTPAELAEDAWRELGDLLADKAGFFAPEHYMTRAMKVDAQFCFSDTLRSRLEEDNNNWSRFILDFD